MNLSAEGVSALSTLTFKPFRSICLRANFALTVSIASLRRANSKADSHFATALQTIRLGG